MDDHWNVKTVRESRQYVSCLKISGVPLLPPLLSKECRKEMQYYKLLAKEVENRISVLKSFFYGDEDSDVEKGESGDEQCALEKGIELPENALQAGFEVSIEKITAVTRSKANSDITTENLMSTRVNTSPTTNNLSITSNVVVKTTTPIVTQNLPKLVIDLSLNINETGKHILESLQKKSVCDHGLELPEHDYDCPKTDKLNCAKPQKDLVYEQEFVTPRSRTPETMNALREKQWSSNSSFHSSSELKNDGNLEPCLEKYDSRGSKNLSGSLAALNTDCDKPKLLRQHSYTILQPSPQLLAHLEYHAIHNGVEMTTISMSESNSNLQSPNRKRRSWDLETAKEKWSSMAIELERSKAVPKKPLRENSTQREAQNDGKSKSRSTSPRERSRSVAPEKCTTRNGPSKSPAEAAPKKNKQLPSQNTPSNVTIVKEKIGRRKPNTKSNSSTPKCRSPRQSPPPQPDAPDDAAASRSRQLYNNINDQQMLQLSSLIEQQKRNQMVLQQTVDGKSNYSNETVSLSQVLNSTSNSIDSLSETIAHTNNCITRCDVIMQKSRDIKSSIAKHIALRSQARLEGNRTRPTSPQGRGGRHDSGSEYDAALTDRTNDTLADLKNITFPSDSDDGSPPSRYAPPTDTDKAIARLEQTIQNSIATTKTGKRQPSEKEREAATTIVAHAKGYLVRRLMQSARVQTTVATIREALECALALHRERAGIRGADVALHRRLIQQITAACYDLHETFIASTPAQRCAMIAADRARRRALASSAKTSPSPRARHVPRTRKPHA